MIGDQVAINYLSPDANTNDDGFTGPPATVTAANGNRDTVTAWMGRTRLFTTNPDANSITLSFLNNLTFNPATFNGVQIPGITQPLGTINPSGASGISTTVSSSNLLLNLQGQSFTRRTTLTTTPTVPLPLTLPPIGGTLGLLGLVSRRRPGRTALAQAKALLRAGARMRAARCTGAGLLVRSRARG